MNVVLMSDCGPFDVYVFARLQERWPSATVLRVGASNSGLTPARRKALLRAPLRTGLHYAEQLLFYRCYRRKVARAISQELFGKGPPPQLDNIIDVPHAALNSSETRRLLQRLAPDVLVVSSAPLLKPEIYSTARLAAVNVHRGISPAYRGESTLFWALYNGDYDQLGITIHHLDPGIDSGRVLAQGFMPLKARESEASLLAAAAPLAAEMLVDFISVAESRPLGRSLPGPGRLYKSRERHVWHDVVYWLRRLFRRQPIRIRSTRRVEYLGAHE